MSGPTGRAHERRISNRAGWRLTEHFFRALFDFGVLTPAGADSFTRMLLGAVGGIVAVGFAMTRLYAGKYTALRAVGSPEPYRRALLGDDLFMIGFAMLLVTFITLLISPSLFPDERDSRILGALPVRKAAIFGAKLAALLLFTGGFIAVTHVSLIPLVLLTSMSRFGEHRVLSRLMTWGLASVSASIFAVLAVTAMVGVLMLVLSGSRWSAATAMMRSVMLALLVLCVPLVFHLPALGASFQRGSGWLAFLPPAWFVGLQQVLLGGGGPWLLHLTTIALVAVGTAVGIVAVVYMLLFRHFERFMLRTNAISPRWSETRGTTVFPNATPWFRGVYRFITATLGRSQLHQGVLFGLSACGAAIAINRLLGVDLAIWLGEGGRPNPSQISAAMETPFALMFACGLGIRAALALPMEHRANWIFRLTEDEGTRREQLRAVERVTATYIIGVPVAAAVPSCGRRSDRQHCSQLESLRSSGSCSCT
jgi:hypothetical protein